MTPEQFAQWLRGFMDAAGPALSAGQLNKIREKLMLVSTPYCTPLPVISSPFWIEPYQPQLPFWYTVTTTNTTIQ